MILSDISETQDIDIKELINRQPDDLPTDDATGAQKTSRERRVAWRIRAIEVGVSAYADELKDEIRAVQKYRLWQLQEKYPCASFQTLSGELFTGGGTRPKARAVLLADTDAGAWYSERLPTRHHVSIREMFGEVENGTKPELTPLENHEWTRMPSIEVTPRYAPLQTAPTPQVIWKSNWDLLKFAFGIG